MKTGEDKAQARADSIRDREPRCRWSAARSRWETVILPGVSKEPCDHPHEEGGPE